MVPSKQTLKYGILLLREAAAECHKIANESAILSHKSDMAAAMKCQGEVMRIVRREQQKLDSITEQPAA